MKLKELFPLMYFINLDSRKDRLKQAMGEFQKLKIVPERMPGKTVNVSTPQTNGMIGCLLSHYACLKEANEKKQNVLIFEDDIKFINDYKRIITAACRELDDYDWDMFYLGANILKPFYQVSPHLAKLTHAQSGHAYGVKAEFIPKILEQLSTHNIMPIDLFYAEEIIPKSNCYIVAPDMVAVQRDSYSNIEQMDATYESYLEKRYKQNFVPKRGADE